MTDGAVWRELWRLYAVLATKTTPGHDEKGRGGEYRRGEADCRLAERARAQNPLPRGDTMTPGERAALRNTDPVPRAWFWPTSLMFSQWDRFRFPRGSDEFGRLTIGIPAPGGIWWIALWRLRDQSGPCARCKQWEPTEVWEFPYCTSCHREITDYTHGCTCPSFLGTVTPAHQAAERQWRRTVLDEEWPTPYCPVHTHLERG